MVQLIIGEKGKGKTTKLLEIVEQNLQKATGNCVYVDKSQKHMYDLNNKVRLVNSTEYSLKNKYEFMGFICGIISQDHDIEYVYFDNFMILANMGVADLEGSVMRLNEISEIFDVNFVATVSVTEDMIPNSISQYVSVVL